MKTLILVCAVVVSLSSTLSNAEKITNWQRLLDNPKCDNGGGFFLWDSKKCLFDTGTLLVDGKWVALKEKTSTTLHKKVRDHDSVGDRMRMIYEGNNIELRLTLTYLPAKCHYANGQCTYRNYLARVTVLRPGVPTVGYEAVGYAGS